MIPGRGAKILYDSWPKNQNTNNRNIITNPIKTFKKWSTLKNLKKKKIAVRIKYTHKCKVLTRVCTKFHICVNSYYFRDLLF